ncbi:tudor/PWWP/MBT superfamily protein [Artemisia annua]|uniref:Tudor/PWWP/MBT superfamily protein n=1 Tax=Artemisia annua TaxID=35608 RepID=A0A2U1NQA2_ARTAN|nr:tudor/PWWP/MBT superfamily protein [Artemisia annua]
MDNTNLGNDSSSNNTSSDNVLDPSDSVSKPAVYDSMISMFDDFAANENVVKHGFQVGDMVWGKVKSHPWWPGHIFSEEFAIPSVRRAKREGSLLVAFFGDSSYGWFDPSELIPFDVNFADKYKQTHPRQASHKAFVKAVEEAMDEVSRRSALGLSCMCRSKDNFRKTDVDGFYAVDVVDYEPGAVYSINAIEKARESFKPSAALDFIHKLALEPTIGSEHTGIDFIKDKAKVVSYRRAVYEEFDETYAQAFGHDPVRQSPRSSQQTASRKTQSNGPLSGQQRFGDISGKGKESAKPNKPKDLAKKDKFLLKRRDESKGVKVNRKEKVKATISPKVEKDDVAIAAIGDYVLQKRVSATDEETDTGTANVKYEAPSKDSSMEEPIKSKVDDDEKMVVSPVEEKAGSDLVDEKKVSTQNDTSNSGPHKTIASQRADNGPKKVKKRPAGELLPEKKKKRKKEQLVDKENVSAEKPPIEDPDRTDSKPTTSLSSETAGTKERNYEIELPRALGDLHSVALDPFMTIKKGKLAKMRRVFLKFRSLVFQKSLNLSPPVDDEEKDTTAQSSKASQNGVKSGRPDDPTKGGRKRGPSDRQEEMAAKKKKKVGDIRNLTKEKKVTKKLDETPTRDVKQPVVTTLKRTEQRGPSVPTMINLKFPPGSSLPSMNELKARFARYGPMDHTATRIFWKTFTCRVVYKQKAHAQAACRFVVESNSLFGNTGVKCTIKEVDQPEPVKVPKEDHQPAMEDRPPGMVPASPSVQLKSILKKSSGEEAAGNSGRGRVKFMLGEDENQMKKNTENKNGASSFSSTSHATVDFNSKNFQKAVLKPSSNPLPILPLPNTTSVTSSSAQFTRPPPNSMHYATQLAPPQLPLPPPPPRPINYGSEMAKPTPAPPRAPPPGNFVHNLRPPNIGPPPIAKVDISQQMLSLLTKCNEVVANVSNVLGYVPYHPL